MPMLDTTTIAASDVTILEVLEDDIAVVEFKSNGAFFIADTSDMAEFGEVFRISNSKRMKPEATTEDKIALARKEYFP
tara:strand:- start:748 stop:981 length:234 start_codon:yes stop_codon:yes gene_type:complete